MKMKTNRILCIYQYAFSQAGGIQTFNRDFIAALENICTAHPSMSAELVSIYDEQKDIRSGLPSMALNGSKFGAARYMFTHARNYDTFIFNHVNLALLAIIIKVLNTKARIIFCVYGVEVWSKLPVSSELIMNRSTILSISTFTTSELRHYNHALEDIRLFPCCIKTDKTSFGHANQFKSDTYNILSVTRLDPSEQYKGIHTVIRALPSLITAIPNIRYTVIGKGEDAKRLQTLAVSLGVADYVDFLGFVDEIGAYYEHCDIFTLPSKKEGFGIVYLEAMQYKKPIIAVNYGGPTDVILDGETGYLCEYDDVQCLADKIELLFNDPALAQKLGENGYQRLVENFTFDKFEKNLQSVLMRS